MPMVLEAVMPVTASAGVTMTVTRRPASALNPIRPSSEENTPPRVVLGQTYDQGYGMNP